MSDIYEKLFFLFLGGIVAWLVTKFSEKTKQRLQTDVIRREAYASWFARSHIYLSRTKFYLGLVKNSVARDATTLSTQLALLNELAERAVESAYGIYFVEPNPMVRATVLKSSERLNVVQSLVDILWQRQIQLEILRTERERIDDPSRLLEWQNHFNETSNSFGVAWTEVETHIDEIFTTQEYLLINIHDEPLSWFQWRRSRRAVQFVLKSRREALEQKMNWRDNEKVD